MALSWFNRLFTSNSRPAARRRPARVPLGVEVLEAREVPTIHAFVDGSGSLEISTDVQRGGDNVTINRVVDGDAAGGAGVADHQLPARHEGEDGRHFTRLQLFEPEPGAGRAARGRPGLPLQEAIKPGQSHEQKPPGKYRSHRPSRGSGT